MIILKIMITHKVIMTTHKVMIMIIPRNSHDYVITTSHSQSKHSTDCIFSVTNAIQLQLQNSSTTPLFPPAGFRSGTRIFPSTSSVQQAT